MIIGSRISAILKNEIYVGDREFRKILQRNVITWKPDEVQVKEYVKDHHECCPYVNTFEPPQKARYLGISWNDGNAYPSSERLI